MAEIHTGDNPIPIPQPTPHNDGPIILTINEESLLNGEWLSDHEIYQYLRLLKTQFPYVNGLEMPCYYTHVKMYIENKTHDFVRIVNNNNAHWLCVAGGLYIEDEDICLFDSLSRYSVDKNLIIKVYT